jgi:hypothetical protein
MRIRLLILLTALFVLAVGCADPGAGNPEEGNSATTTLAEMEGTTAVSDPSSDGDGNPTSPESGDTTSTTRSTKEPERVPDEINPPVTGETPTDLLAQIIADAADRVRVSDSDVTVVRDEFAIWNDGSLGCPEPGVLYTQATVDGYWVVLQAGGAEYDYRANTKGYWFLCEGAGLPGQPPSG